MEPVRISAAMCEELTFQNLLQDKEDFNTQCQIKFPKIVENTQIYKLHFLTFEKTLKEGKC